MDPGTTSAKLMASVPIGAAPLHASSRCHQTPCHWGDPWLSSPTWLPSPPAPVLEAARPPEAGCHRAARVQKLQTVAFRSIFLVLALSSSRPHHNSMGAWLGADCGPFTGWAPWHTLVECGGCLQRPCHISSSNPRAPTVAWCS